VFVSLRNGRALSSASFREAPTNCKKTESNPALCQPLGRDLVAGRRTVAQASCVVHRLSELRPFICQNPQHSQQLELTTTQMQSSQISMQRYPLLKLSLFLWVFHG
jgi:hypothetical protein